MFTAGAARSLSRRQWRPTVADVRQLVADGWSRSQIRANVDANRWRRIGRAIVLHNGEPSQRELGQVALVVLGPRAVLTSFTALDVWGLEGWERDPIHVLVPRGARVARPDGLPLRIHYTDHWRPETLHNGRGLHRAAYAAVLAAASFARPRPACGLLAAVVQQRLVRSTDLVDAITEAPRTRHRAHLLAAARDIAQGAEALSEIDFARLCRSGKLPEPRRQTRRVEPDGRRRYVDGEWIRRDGRRVVVEVDGALHLVAARWWDDQLRQNELTLADDLVLRYPSVILRCEKALVVEQLRRALQGDLPARRAS